MSHFFPSLDVNQVKQKTACHVSKETTKPSRLNFLAWRKALLLTAQLDVFFKICLRGASTKQGPVCRFCFRSNNVWEQPDPERRVHVENELVPSDQSDSRTWRRYDGKFLPARRFGRHSCVWASGNLHCCMNSSIRAVLSITESVIKYKSLSYEWVQRCFIPAWFIRQNFCPRLPENIVIDRLYRLSGSHSVAFTQACLSPLTQILPSERSVFSKTCSWTLLDSLHLSPCLFHSAISHCNHSSGF